MLSGRPAHSIACHRVFAGRRSDDTDAHLRSVRWRRGRRWSPRGAVNLTDVFITAAVAWRLAPKKPTSVCCEGFLYSKWP